MHKNFPLLLLLVTLLATCLAAPGNAASTRGEVFLDGQSIHLGDLFSDVGSKADTVVADAPAPGQKVVFDATALVQLAHTYGLDWKLPSNYVRVTVTRESQVLTAAMIRDKVIAELGKTGAPADLDVAMDNQGFELHRAKNEPLQFSLTDVQFDPIKCRFKAILSVANGDEKKTDILNVSGRAMPMVDVAILVHPIDMGSPITEADVQWSHVALDKAGADAITSPARLADMETSHRLNAQNVLRLRDLRHVRLVTKGSLVQMVVEMEGMQLSTQGRALSDGAMGETIRVLNTQSNRTVDATVSGSGKVSVTPREETGKIAAR